MLMIRMESDKIIGSFYISADDSVSNVGEVSDHKLIQTKAEICLLVIFLDHIHVFQYEHCVLGYILVLCDVRLIASMTALIFSVVDILILCWINLRFHRESLLSHTI